MLEKEFQSEVLKLARMAGWTLRYHTHDSRRSQKGFPDLVLIRIPEILYLELKRVGEKPTPEQEEWVHALHACGQEVRVVTPEDWPWLAQRLARRRTTRG